MTDINTFERARPVWVADASGNQITSFGGSTPGTAGTPSSQVTTVQGITNGTPIIVSIAADLRSGTGTKANVASSASSVTVLASNAARKGATIYNDSTAILYLDLSGGTASSSSYSVQVAASGYYEVPYGYSGLITGIWASANGNARVTEFA